MATGQELVAPDRDVRFGVIYDSIINRAVVRFRDRSVVISGASSGIGRALALELAREGWSRRRWSTGSPCGP